MAPAAWLMLAALAAMAGCVRRAAPPGATARPVAPPVTATSAGPQITLHVLDRQGYAQVLKRHRGRVVLVDFWATWCPECLKLLPHTVELAERFRRQGLAVISVSLDFPQDDRDRVLDILRKHHATFDNFISRYGSDARSIDAFEIENGALPNLKLYDRRGKLRKVFSAGRMPPEPFDSADIDRAVEQLLAEPSGAAP